MNNDFQEKDAIRYFLGELSDAERAAVEERFFADDEFSEWLDEVETDLIDSYVRGELAAAQRRNFETNFLVSERRRSRARAAAALFGREKPAAAAAPVAAAENAPPSFWESLKGFFSVPNLAYASLGILMLALVGGLFWFFPRSNDEIVKIGNQSPTPEPSRQASPAITPTPAPTSAPIASPAPTAESSPAKTPAPENPEKPAATPKPEKTVRDAAPVLASVDLFSAGSRSGGNEPNRLILKPGTANVFLRLRFQSEEEFTGYRIDLRDAGGNLIASRNARSRRALGITVPAQKLRRGGYKISLTGAKPGQNFELLDIFELLVEKK